MMVLLDDSLSDDTLFETNLEPAPNIGVLCLTRFDGQGRCVDLSQAAWRAGSEPLPVASNAAGLR